MITEKVDWIEGKVLFLKIRSMIHWLIKDNRRVEIFDRFDGAVFSYFNANLNLDSFIQSKVDSMFNISENIIGTWDERIRYDSLVDSEYTRKSYTLQKYDGAWINAGDIYQVSFKRDTPAVWSRCDGIFNGNTECRSMFKRKCFGA